MLLRIYAHCIDGVRFAAELVPTAVAAALGLSTSGGRAITDLEAYLRP